MNSSHTGQRHLDSVTLKCGPWSSSICLTGSRLKMQDLWPSPRPAEDEPRFYQYAKESVHMLWFESCRRVCQMLGIFEQEAFGQHGDILRKTGPCQAFTPVVPCMGLLFRNIWGDLGSQGNVRACSSSPLPPAFSVTFLWDVPDWGKNVSIQQELWADGHKKGDSM